MKNFLYKSMLILSSHKNVQKILEKNIYYSQYLLGIGSGSFVDSSGEKLIIKKLREKYIKDKHELVIFDVGANKGSFIKLLVSYISDLPYKIYGFEPSINSFKWLSENFNNNKHIHINNFGFGNKKEILKLFYNEKGSEIASLFNRKLDHFGISLNKYELVNIETLDNFCYINNINRIDLLKMDVEGNELNVLMGGQKIISENKVDFISFEFGGCNIDSRTYFQDFWYLFKDLGNWAIYRITPSCNLIPIYEYKEEYEQFRTTNYFATRIPT